MVHAQGTGALSAVYLILDSHRGTLLLPAHLTRISALGAAVSCRLFITCHTIRQLRND